MILIAILIIMLTFGSGCQSAKQAETTKTQEEGTPLKMPDRKETYDNDLVKIADLLDAPDLVGKRVQVTGMCLGYGSEHMPGPPPRTRSDWALEDDGAIIYVTGPFPAGCSGLEPGVDPVLFTAEVAVDTVTSYADNSKSARYFLVLIE